MGRKYRIGNVCLFIEKRVFFQSKNVDDIKMAGRKQQVAPTWKKLDEKTWTLIDPHHFLIMCTGDAPNVNASRTKPLLMKTKTCSNLEFLLEQLKNCQGGKNLAQKRLRGLATWKVMLKNAWKDIANWRTRKTEELYNVSKPCLDEHNFLENCQKCARKLS